MPVIAHRPQPARSERSAWNGSIMRSDATVFT